MRLARALALALLLSLLFGCPAPIGGGRVAAPTLIAPADDPFGSDPVPPVSLALEWSASAGAASYLVELSDGERAATRTVAQTGIVASTLWGGPLDPGTMYQVILRARAGSGELSQPVESQFWTGSDERVGQWVLDAPVVGDPPLYQDRIGDLHGVPVGSVLPLPVVNRRGESDCALEFCFEESDPEKPEILVHPTDEVTWPVLGSGFSFSVWVALPQVDPGTTSKQDIFAKPYPSKTPNGTLYLLAVEYGRSATAVDSYAFTLTLNDAQEGAAAFGFPPREGTGLLGGWVHLAASRDFGGTFITLVEDGEQSVFDCAVDWLDENSLYTDFSKTFPTSDLLVGNGISTRSFRGRLDDLLIWNRALSPTELVALSEPVDAAVLPAAYRR